jgi:exosome complex component RRP46
MDAGVPMKSTCSAITVMVHKDGLLLLDPTALELEVILSSKLKSSQSVHTFAFDNNDDRCLVAISNGCFTQEEVMIVFTTVRFLLRFGPSSY